MDDRKFRSHALRELGVDVLHVSSPFRNLSAGKTRPRLIPQNRWRHFSLTFSLSSRPLATGVGNSFIQ